MTVNEAEVARKLFASPVVCLLAAAQPQDFPDSPLPEVALVGRSNVGKSSLVNALTGRRSLARASTRPGRTQQIVFFEIGQRLMLADLPGYGFAEAPQETMKQWNNLVRTYLKKRNALQLVGLLIDSRHGPMAQDLGMMKELNQAAVPYQVILTKADKIKPLEREERLRQTEELLKKQPAARPTALMTSADKGIGIDSLQQVLAAFAAPPL